MNTCHDIINLSPDFFFEDVEYIKSLRQLNSTKVLPSTIFKKEVFEKLKSLSLNNSFTTYIFSKQPNLHTWPIHIDPDFIRAHCLFAFNIIIQGQGVMKWFAVPKDKGQIGTNKVNDAYVYFKEEDCTLMDEWTEGKCAFVKIDVAHQAWNYDSDERIAISIRWNPGDSYDDVYTKFKEVFNL